MNKVNSVAAQEVRYCSELYGIDRAMEEQESSDAVDRAEVKKIAKEMYLEVGNMDIDATTISDCITCTASKCREVFERKLQALPPATSAHKKGKWIVLKDEYGDIHEAVCSCCDANGHHKWKFCSNCGAEMGVAE